jgi:hypothetical protein
MSGPVAAYAHFGAVLRNPQWSWSARTKDGGVVLTLWKDEFNYKTKPVSYDLRGHPRLSEWIGRPGNRERIENLKWARDHSRGTFRVVIATAKDDTADPRQVAEAYPQTKMIMRLTDLDEETGEFRAEIVPEGGNAARR